MNNNHQNIHSSDLQNTAGRDYDRGSIGRRFANAAAAFIAVALLSGPMQAAPGETANGTVSEASNGKIEIKSVRFKDGSLSLSGNLHFPVGFVEGSRYAAVVVVHPAGGVKEQTAGLYAQKLAQQGFVTLSFDSPYQGASEGEPRFLEDPAARVEAIRSAVDFLSTLAYVDPNRIGALGICAGSGYTLNAAQTDHRIKAMATVSAVDMGATFRTGWDGKVQLAAQIELLKAAAAQRVAEANGAEPKYIEYVPSAPDSNTPRDLREASEYYLTARAKHPNSQNRMLFTSVDKIFAFDALNQADLLTQPVLFIAGSEAGSRWQSEELHTKLKGSKELFIVSGATHMDLYDRPQYVNPAVDKLTSFLKRYL
jgi:hypothetical protein